MVEQATKSENYRNQWNIGCTLDDQLWYQCLASDRYMVEHRNRMQKTHDERLLWLMLRRGIYDQAPEDRPWDGAVRSMRYSAIMGDRLWSMIETERKRVRVPSFPQLVGTDRIVLGRSFGASSQ